MRKIEIGVAGRTTATHNYIMWSDSVQQHRTRQPVRYPTTRCVASSTSAFIASSETALQVMSELKVRKKADQVSRLLFEQVACDSQAQPAQPFYFPIVGIRMSDEDKRYSIPRKFRWESNTQGTTRQSPSSRKVIPIDTFELRFDRRRVD